MTAKEQPPGCDPRGLADNTPAGRESSVIVAPGGDGGPLTEDWLRRHGYRLAADERARQMRTARIRLGRLLYSDPPAGRGCWECPGQFGPDGRWAPHCGDAA